MVTPTRHNARAAGTVVLAMAAITASDALVKGLLEEIKPSQFIFVRALVILLILGGVLCVTRPWGTEWSLLLLLSIATAASALREI